MRDPQRKDVWALPPGVTRLVVLGDPHGDYLALEQVIAAELDEHTAIASAGDNVGYGDGPDSSRFIERLRAVGGRSVYGNHEDWMGESGELFLVSDSGASRKLTPDAYAWCRSLPARLDVRFAGAPDWRVRIAHTDLGTDEDVMWPFLNEATVGTFPEREDVDVLVFGHSHGAAIYSIVGERVAARRLGLLREERVSVTTEPGSRYAADAGSLGRPGYHPAPARVGMGTYVVLDARFRTVEIVALEKRTAGGLLRA